MNNRKADMIKEIKNVWEYKGKLMLMFVDQYDRFRTFREYNDNFYEFTCNRISDYELRLNDLDIKRVNDVITIYRITKRLRGGSKYGL